VSPGPSSINHGSKCRLMCSLYRTLHSLTASTSHSITFKAVLCGAALCRHENCYKVCNDHVCTCLQ